MSENNDDDFLSKIPKMIRKVNLFLQLPDEQYGEVVRDYDATFFQISEQNNENGFKSQAIVDLKINMSASQVLNDPASNEVT